MFGFRVYFEDGEFKFEDELTDGGNRYIGKDSTEHWYSSAEHAEKAANILNIALAKDEKDLLENESKNLIVKKCKDCGYPFGITFAEYLRFTKKKLSIPARCFICREKKKIAK